MERVRNGFVVRLLAAIVDAIVLCAVIVPVSVVLTFTVGATVASIVNSLLVLAYFALEVVQAQTVGKMAFGLTIARQDGAPATQDLLVRRYVYKMLPTAVMLVAALPIPLIWLLNVPAMLLGLAVAAGALMALRPDRLALHDQLLGTAVYGPALVTVTVPFANTPVWSQQQPQPVMAGAVPPVPPAQAAVPPLPPIPQSQPAA